MNKFKIHPSTRFDCDLEVNNIYVKKAIQGYNKRKGPRVGDYLVVEGKITRVTYVWGREAIQAGGHQHGQYFLGKGGWCSYSGSLDSSVDCTGAKLVGHKKGDIWFFSKDWMQAEGGITATIECRVYLVSKAPKNICCECGKSKKLEDMATTGGIKNICFDCCKP